MDHLLLPKDPIPSTLSQIPFVSREKYDGGPFMDYPLRKGKGWLLSLANEGGGRYLSYRNYQQHDPGPKQEQESFYQTWLFFGFLNELLGDCYREEDFLDRTKPDEMILSTEKLIPLMESFWKVSLESESEHRRNYFEHLHECLRLAPRVLNATHPDFNWKIKYSIISVHETIGFAAAEASEVLGFRYVSGTWLGRNCYGPQIHAQMFNVGWCPSEIAGAADKLPSAQACYFMSRMNKKGLKRDHRSCTSELCNCLQIDLKTYRTKHRYPDCSCKPASPNPEGILEILEKGSIPLLRITEKSGDRDNLNIEVVELTSETPYVAISHVWADGLGNPLRNSIPSCQLSYLRETASSLPRSSVAVYLTSTRPTYIQDKPLLIWLDTLCCPVSPPDAKSLALNLMRKTYEDAEHVLVLNSTLQGYKSFDISHVEIFARLLTSGWISRLWTLQEARLARTLWIQLKDKSVNLDRLIAGIVRRGGNDVRCLAFSSYLIRQHRILRPMLYLENVAENSTIKDMYEGVGGALNELDESLHRRSTTVASDEALCIGTLMDLSTEEILKVPATAAARMAKVWELIVIKYGGIPQRIIAFKQPRLMERGKRWMPASLIIDEQGPRKSVSYSPTI